MLEDQREDRSLFYKTALGLYYRKRFPENFGLQWFKVGLRYLVDKVLFQPRSQGSFSSLRARRRSADIFLKITTAASSS